MMIPNEVAEFIEKQRFVIVSTISPDGKIHCAAKGMVDVSVSGLVCIIDLYCNKTFDNLKNNPTVSITAVDEDKFIGYTLQGRGKIIPKESIHDNLIAEWEERITARISDRVISGVQTMSKTVGHFEAKLPHKPKYLIELEVENIIDLAKPKSKKGQEQGSCR